MEDQSAYIDFVESRENNTYSFTLSRKKVYLNGDLIVRCKISGDHSPSGAEIVSTFRMVVRKLEE